MEAAGDAFRSGTPGVFSLALTEAEFAAVASLARRTFGLELGSGKEQLVVARVGKLMRRLGYTTFREYYRYVESDRSGDALVTLIDALATNHTSFFREQAHFDFLVQRVLPEWRSTGARRIWSAASSTGEEPYTIALVAREYFGVGSGSLPRILATDISTRVLDTARRGIYQADRFPAEMAPWLRKHLLRGEGRWEGCYRMRQEILDMIEFRRLNLIEPLPEMGQFAVIFCRNVMIYFSRETQQRVIDRLTACIEPAGYLFVGHAESLTGIRHDLEQIQPAVYRKRGRSR